MSETKTPSIVTIGGGTGSSSVLRGLKGHGVDLTAIVTMFDSGGSSGLLRREFGCPPLGDLRQCLLALGDDSDAPDVWRTLVEFRFDADSSLRGHSLGNLLMAALTTLRNDVELVVEEMSRILRTHGHVVPVSLELADLCAELEDGTLVRGESEIDLRRKRLPHITNVFLDPPVSANPRALEAILAADAIVMGPGDLYTSVVPNLLVDGVCDALRRTRAARVYVCNLMTKLGETDGYRASDFATVIDRYLGGGVLDWVIVNDAPIDADVREAYRPESAEPVEADLEALQRVVPNVCARPLADQGVPVRHDPAALTEVVLAIAKTANAPLAPRAPRRALVREAGAVQ